MANSWDNPIAYVLRANTQGFSAGAQVSQLEYPAFGRLVKVQTSIAEAEVMYGILYDINVEDDPIVRQLILADAVSEETIHDQRTNRIAPLEINVVAIAYRSGDWLRHALPPRPPLSLDPVYLCDPTEVQEVAGQFGYFRVILESAAVPGEQLLAATLLEVARTLPAEEQYSFLVNAGREAARILSNEPARLDYLLRLIYPS